MQLCNHLTTLPLPPYHLAVFSHQEATTRRTLNALDQVLSLYEKNLGLRFINTGSEWHSASSLCPAEAWSCCRTFINHHRLTLHLAACCKTTATRRFWHLLLHHGVLQLDRHSMCRLCMLRQQHTDTSRLAGCTAARLQGMIPPATVGCTAQQPYLTPSAAVPQTTCSWR